MQLRAKIVIAVFAAIGVMLLAIQPRTYASKTEDWMEETVPLDVPGYTLVTSSKTDVGAKMDQMTYDILDPFGIITRYYRGEDGRSYDMVIIAGNTRKSFHDPQVCFSAQNWYFRTTEMRRIDIPSMGGEVSVTVLGIERPGVAATAMYFYKTPLGIRHSPAYVPFDLTGAKLSLRDNIDAAFYRFIVSPATVPRDESAAALEEAVQADVAALAEFAEAALGQLAHTEDGRYFLVED